MANLWGGTTGPQLLGFIGSQQQLELQKNQQETEKKRLNFLQKSEQTRLDIAQQELNLRKQKHKAEMLGINAANEKLITQNQLQNYLLDIAAPGGRRRIGQSQITPEDKLKRMLPIIAAMQGKMPSGFKLGPQAPKVTLHGDRIKVTDTTTGETIIQEAPKTQREIEKEKEKQEKIQRETEEKKETAKKQLIKQIYDDLIADWNEWAKQERKDGEDPGEAPVGFYMNKAKSLAKEIEEKGYAPVKGVAGTEAKGFWKNLGGPFTINPLSKEGALGWYSKMLGIGPSYKLGGRPAKQPSIGFLNPEKQAFINHLILRKKISPQKAKELADQKFGK